MKRESYTIHDNKGCVLDCACVVDVTSDGQTASFEFPQLAQENDNMGPSVYVSMDGTRLKVSLTDRDDVQVSFKWDEKGNRWIQCGG
jgi:hypothetical protein